MASPSLTTQIAIGVGSVFVTVLGVIILKIIRKEKIPTEWEHVGIVKQLFIYPLKSGKGISSKTLFLTDKGMQEIGKTDGSMELKDRSFLIYKDKDKEIRTARQLPKSLLINIQGAKNGVILSAPNKVDLYINVPKVKRDVKVTFGKETFICTDCGDSAAKWLSSFLLGQGEELRLGYGDGSSMRNVLRDHNKWAQHYTNMDNHMAGIFSDLAALHLVNLATVDDLNKNLPAGEQEVSFMNFRPNILVEGPKVFAEDTWKYVKIGEVVAKVCLECLRCIESTVSQNGEMNIQREPLRTLERYRQSEGPFKSGVMGTYLKVLKTGIMNRGDPVYISKNT